jgi:uncharacterized membrane protein
VSRGAWRRELPSWLLLAFMYAASATAWPRAPARLPVHWNAHGVADRFGGRLEALWLIPLIALALYALMRFLPRADPGRDNYSRFAGAYDLVRTGVITFLAALHALMLAPLFGRTVDMVAAVATLVAGLLILLGAAMGKLRPNWFFGIRTPWTLSSKTAWVRTHRLGGWLFVGAGLAVLATAAGAPRWTVPVVLAATLAASGTAIVYSYLVWRRAPDRLPPAGTSPGD